MASQVAAVDEEAIANFKSTKRFKIDEYFKSLMNKIDIKVAETTSAIAAEATSSATAATPAAATTSASLQTHAQQMENLERVGKKLVDEIEKICNYNLASFESNLKEILAIFVQNKTLEDSDDINKLVFRKFCFLYNTTGQDAAKSNASKVSGDEASSASDAESPNSCMSNEKIEAIAKLKLKLVIADWYLNERQLEFLK